LNVSSGGTASSTVISNGRNEFSYGNTVGAIVGSGGEQMSMTLAARRSAPSSATSAVSRLPSLARLSAGGYQYVNDPGLAIGTTVNSGNEIVYCGTTVS
jgi:autotransporter passenger strand-loop-strand repeat protein